MSTNAIAAIEKAVLSMAMPMTKEIKPSSRKAPEALRLFSFIDYCFLSYAHFKDFTSAYGLGLSNNAADLPLRVASKKDNK